jgi:hypothetical protein
VKEEAVGWIRMSEGEWIRRGGEKRGKKKIKKMKK